MTTELKASFNAAVARWLEGKVGEPVTVTNVSAYGTDWAGDTEGGFYSRCELQINFTTPTREIGYRTVEGEEFKDLWEAVMHD